jgi:hypothetical protein
MVLMEKEYKLLLKTCCEDVRDIKIALQQQNKILLKILNRN